MFRIRPILSLVLVATGLGAPVTGRRCGSAQHDVALSFPGDFETTGDLLARLQARTVLGLADDVYSTHVEEALK